MKYINILLSDGINEDIFIKLYNEGATIPELSEFFNISKNDVMKYIKMLGLKRAPSVDVNIKKWTSLNKNNWEKAYVLGLLYNSIFIDENSIAILYEISINKEQLELMSHILVDEWKYNGIINYDSSNGRYFIRVEDTKLLNLISVYGKTFDKKDKFPMFFAKPLSVDFIRGYIDSGTNGNISSDSKIPYVQIYGSRGFLTSLLYYGGVSCKIKEIKNKQSKQGCFIRMSGEKMRRFLIRIYGDCIGLDAEKSCSNKNIKRIKKILDIH